MADYKNGENRSRSRHHWEAHIRAQQESGLSRAEYCRRHGLSYHALTYWQRKLPRPSQRQTQLIPVPTERITQHRISAATSGVKILLDDRIGIEVSEQFSPRALSQVLAVLESR